MNEQQQPKAQHSEQEWTPETLWEFIGGKIDNLPKPLSDADTLECYSAIGSALDAADKHGYQRGVRDCAKEDVKDDIIRDLLREARQRIGATAWPSLAKRIDDALEKVKEVR